MSFFPGISEEDLLIITTSVNIVFHSAATVRFNDDLKEAGLLNSLATKVLLDLCLQIDNLKSVVYVSTAYCNPGRKYVKESIYETVNDEAREHFLNAVKHFSKNQLNSLAKYVKVNKKFCLTFVSFLRNQFLRDLIQIPTHLRSPWLNKLPTLTEQNFQYQLSDRRL